VDTSNHARVAGYVILRDADGRRHALRTDDVQGVSELDDLGDECVVTVTGGQVLHVLRPLDDILSSLS